VEDLTVQIPKKYKKALIERFSLKNAKLNSGSWEIKKPCPLCENYIDCEKCPYDKFSSMGLGCMIWIRKILDYDAIIYIWDDCIEWEVKDNKQARKKLKLLNRKAKELIKWV